MSIYYFIVYEKQELGYQKDPLLQLSWEGLQFCQKAQVPPNLGDGWQDLVSARHWSDSTLSLLPCGPRQQGVSFIKASKGKSTSEMEVTVYVSSAQI